MNAKKEKIFPVQEAPHSSDSHNRPETVALMTHPRSVSTAFEACFAGRSDCIVHHEPAARIRHFYYLRKQQPNGRSRQQAREDVIDAYKKKVPGKFTFIKDMAYYYKKRMSIALLGESVFTFLVRRPEDALLSHWKKNSYMTEEEAGYDALLWLFRKIKAKRGEPPIVVEGNDLRERPDVIMQKYCAAVGIPFMPEALEWKAGERKEWDVWKGGTAETNWHQEVEASTRMQPPQKLAQEDDLPIRVREMLPRCREHYQALLAEGRRITKD